MNVAIARGISSLVKHMATNELKPEGTAPKTQKTSYTGFEVCSRIRPNVNS